MQKCKTNVSDKQQRNKDTVYFAKYYMIRKSAARYRIACILHVEYKDWFFWACIQSVFCSYTVHIKFV